MKSGDNRCRVLMVIGLYHPIVGGAEKVCRALARSFRERGMAVTVLTQRTAGLRDYEVIDGLPVYRKMRWWHPFGLAYMMSVLIFLLRHRQRYDIIQCFGLFLFVPPAFIVQYLFKKKLVLRLLCSGSYGDFAGIEPLLLKRLIRACARRADGIVCMSHDIQRELIAHHFPVDALISIPNGVDTNRFVPRNAPGEENSAAICYVGRVEAQKGLAYLLRALAILVAGGKAVKLFIVGDGRQKILLQDLANDLMIGEHVMFTGFQNDVLTYYQRARAFVLPSLSEGMSSALLEAMACGLPVITTRVGGCEEMLGADLGGNDLPQGHYHIGKRGILVNPRDEQALAESMGKLLQDDMLAKRLGLNARDFVRGAYSHAGVVSAYQDLYGRLLQARSDI